MKIFKRKPKKRKHYGKVGYGGDVRVFSKKYYLSKE